VTVLFGASVKAADIAARAPIYQPPPPIVPNFTWIGCYIGGNIGGTWTNRDWTDKILGDPLYGTDLGSYTTRGVLGGAQAGCNHQIGAEVFGIQVDYDWSTDRGSNNSVAFVLPIITEQSRIHSLASVTGRVGYAWDRFLGYVKAGGALQRSSYDLLVAGLTGASTSETRGGWTAGIGGEYAFLDWLTGFIEYDYYSFGPHTNTFACPTCGLPALTAPFDITTNISVVKTGINFKFGFPAGF
jgi:outer membrane immunogenic protein